VTRTPVDPRPATADASTEALSDVGRRDLREGGRWSPGQRIKNALIYIVARASIEVAARLPRAALGAVCRALGLAAYAWLPRARTRVRARLEAGLGGPPGERRVRAAFRTSAAMLADTIALFDPRERATVGLSLDEGSRRVFREALDEGRGVVFVSAHLGPWERMAALLVEEGFPVATVARESYDPRFTQLYERLRAPRGVRSIYRGKPGAAAAIARELRKGRAVGFLIDLRSRVKSERAALFGAEALVPVGPSRIALARRAAVVVGAPSRRTVLIERVRSDDLAPGPEGERALVLRLARALEVRIAAWPEAWLGLYAPPGVTDHARLLPARLRPPSDPR
jgi:Kdo2-lipid IVA lauroyltransferase/acyltransferase